MINKIAAHKALFFTCLFLLGLLIISCKKKKEAEPEKVETTPVITACSPKYNTDIQPIINTRCAINGCHVAGATTGDFTSYTVLKSKIDNGQVNQMVFELKIMPPASATKLNTDELDKLKCWITNGAPQN